MTSFSILVEVLLLGQGYWEWTQIIRVMKLTSQARAPYHGTEKNGHQKQTALTPIECIGKLRRA